MTPIHDGSRTPNASSEWDPTVSNTYPSPGYNPSKLHLINHHMKGGFSIFNFIGTPGYQMNGPYTPQTPGTMYDSTYSPYQASPGYQSVVSTPSPATGYGQSPSSNNPYNTPSSGYSPNMPYNPQTPGAGLDVLPMTDWHTVDIEVGCMSFLQQITQIKRLQYDFRKIKSFFE